jgi:hypothetical protein
MAVPSLKVLLIINTTDADRPTQLRQIVRGGTVGVSRRPLTDGRLVEAAELS